MMITWWKDCHKCWNEKTAAGWRGILKTSDTLLWRKKNGGHYKIFWINGIVENKFKYPPPPHAQKIFFRSSPVGKTYDAEDVSKKAKTSTDQYKHTKDPKPEGGCQIFYSADFLPITWRNPNNFLLFSKHHLNRRFSTLSLATLSRLSRNFANFMYDIMTPQIIWIFSWLCK